MKRLKELSEFLRTRREKLSPDNYGFDSTARRRTPGLRREEVAQLANISTTLYTKLEQGRDINVSSSVLESISKALKLTYAEKEHLFVLSGKSFAPCNIVKLMQIDPSYKLILDNIKKYPAYILDNHWNVVAWNDTAIKVFGDYNTFSEENLNVLWRVFTDVEFKKRLVNWEEIASKLLSIFRSGSVYFIDQEWYDQLVENLKNKSPEFKRWWSMHEVNILTSDIKIIKHPLVGELRFKHNTFTLNEYQNFILTIYVPNDSIDTEKALTILENL